MKQKAVRLIVILAILSLFLVTSPTQASPVLTSSEVFSQKVEPKLVLPLAEGLTSSEWQNIQNQILSNSSQKAYLKASNTETKDEFGASVAISGDTLVVGAPNEDSSATGGPSNNDASMSGAAYVFVRGETGWTQQAYLKASNAGIEDFFGYSVAIDGDTLVVGAYGEASSTADDPNNNTAQSAGAAYVFVRTGTTWAQTDYLKASNIDFADHFGWAVAIDGDTIVVAANHEDSSFSGGESDDTLTNSGAVYVFVRSGGAWSQQAFLKASNPDMHDYFGWSVAISGDTIIASAPWEDSDGQGGMGGQYNNNAPYAGAAYVFVRNDNNWTQQAYLKASNIDADDVFGDSVDISGDTIVVGAYGESSNATGVNGDQSNDDASMSGAAYVIVRDGTTWTHQAYLKASNTDTYDNFGNSVSIFGDAIVVGAPYESSSATGGQDDDSANSAGAAYVFVRSGTNWSQQAYLKASNAEVEDYFGDPVAISEKTLIVGVPYEDSGTTDDPDNNDAESAGAAYVFDITYYLFLPLILR